MGYQDCPLVSVAIITYNQKKFLRECIESILAQDYPNIEIVIADDASSDGTQDMLIEYEKKFPGKFVLRLANVNGGITANSNLAHFACSGKYIAWMGGDDVMLPGKISKQVFFMEANPECTICYHDLDVFDSDTDRSIYIRSKKVRPRQGDIRTCIRYGVFNGACSTMVRTDKTPVSGYNQLLPVASDWLYWVEALGNGGTIKYIDEVLGRYRRHSNNITRKSDSLGQNSVDHLNACNIIIQKYPEFLRDAIYRYAINIRSIRKEVPYLSAMLVSFRLTFSLRAILGVAVFFITLGKVRL
ncbi:glycosyltransferase [Pseudomonadota bacterium DY0742]